MHGVQRIATARSGGAGRQPGRGCGSSAAAPFSCLRRLHTAIDDRDEKKAAELLRSCASESVDISCPHRGRTALHAACSAGLGSIAEQLIAAGADVNATDDSDATPLRYACSAGQLTIINLLLKHGADASLVGDDDGSSILEVSIRLYPDELTSMLITSGCSLDSVNRKGQTVLHVCAELNKSDFAELLLRRGCAVDKEDDCRRTALSIAAGNGSSPLLRLLIEAGADLNAQDVQKNSPLSYAVQSGFPVCVKQLIDAGADQSVCNTKRITPLMYAVQALNLPILELLLTGTGPSCPAIDMADWQGCTPLSTAVRAATQARRGNDDEQARARSAVRLLIGAGCSVNKPDGASGQTPLILSCHGDCTDVTEMLLAAGADARAGDKAGNTALHVAAQCGNVRSLELLLLLQTEECRVNASNADGQTPIFKAADRSVPVQIAEKLVASGADVNACDSRLSSPLHAAIETGHSQMAVVLINAGCDYNLLDSAGMSPLCLACQKGDRLVMARLLAKPDCDVNLGLELPLHVAIRKGDRRLAEALIARKASINKLNDNGQSPLLLAVEAYDQQTIDLLLGLGVTVGPPRCLLLPDDGADPPAATAAGATTAASAAAAVKPRRRGCCVSHEDPHPHVVLQPLFECVRFENVQLFKLLLDYHYRTPYALLRTLHDMLTINHVDGRSLVSESVRHQLLLELRTALDSVRSLQQLCRGAVRERLGTAPAAKVGGLPLPASLQSFLLYKDCDRTSGPGS